MSFGAVATMEDSSRKGINIIKVVGVGTGAGNVVKKMIYGGLPHLKFIVVDTDKKCLLRLKIEQDHYLLLGPNVTKGKGAKGNPYIGAQAALDSIEEVTEFLTGSEVVILIVCLGCGTGTGAAPLIAKLSRKLGAFTIAFVTTPFQIEGNRRMNHAKQGLEELRRCVDVINVLPNDRLFLIANRRSPKIGDMLSLADKRLFQGVVTVTRRSNQHGWFRKIDFSNLSINMGVRGLKKTRWKL